VSPRIATTAALALGLATLASSGCGPSFQVVYEGDARFEHCYALDDTPTAPMQAKTDCWTQWMKRYTYGQTRNRVDYAAMRAKALQAAHSAPTDEAMMGAAPGGGTPRVVGADEPVTTNPFATPPKTMSEGDAGTDAHTPAPIVRLVPVAPFNPAAPAGPPTPDQACTNTCRGTWDTCRAACKKVTCRSCDRSYGACMKRCF
jgi:hypothetical protein